MTTNCESCGMPVEDGIYCEHCTDDAGNLQSFEERLERMSQWRLASGRAADRSQAEADSLAYMATMPAWRNHPRVKATSSSPLFPEPGG